MAWHVVIAGGGFAGFYAARSLERKLPRNSARITIVNDTNFFLYTPLLPGAAAGTLEPRHVVVPLREALGRTELRLGTVTGAEPDRNCLTVRAHEGRDEDLFYDHLIVALGSVSRTLPIPGLAEHAIGFKTLAEAIALRNQVLRCLEYGESVDDPRERERYLTFVFVGAGYAGVEGLAELQDFASDTIELYPRCRVQGMRWILVEREGRIMPEVRPSLSDFGTPPPCPTPPSAVSRPRRRPPSTGCARRRSPRTMSPRRWAGAAGARSPTARSASSSTWGAARRSPRPWACAGAAPSPGSWPARTTWRSCRGSRGGPGCSSTGTSGSSSGATRPSSAGRRRRGWRSTRPGGRAAPTATRLRAAGAPRRSRRRTTGPTSAGRRRPGTSRRCRSRGSARSPNGGCCAGWRPCGTSPRSRPASRRT